MAGAAAVDQHQRLFLIHVGVADGLAAPATGVYQPAGRELDRAVGQLVMNDLGIALSLAS
jgi:hypothetical protein